MLLWIASHWAVLASVVTAIIFTWRSGKFFAWVVTSITGFFAKLNESHDTIHLVATNHLPHIQVEMEKANGQFPGIHAEMAKANTQLEGLREDFRALTLALLARRIDE